jgi:hypothetical protein
MHFIKKIKNSKIIKMNLGDAACSSNDNRNQPDEDEEKILNSEKNQQDPELRKKFEELTTKDNDGTVVKKVSFEMNENDGIEKRAINRKQIDYLIDVLHNKINKTKNYHNYKNAYVIQKVGETLELFGKNKKKSENGGKMIALEDIWEIHRSVGFTGRTAMEAEAKKVYDNMTRPAIETFVKL